MTAVSSLMDRLLDLSKNSLQYGNSMCPSMIRKLKVIVYFRKVFLLSKFKYFCFVTILDMSLISRSCKNDHIIFNVGTMSLEARNIRLVDRIIHLWMSNPNWFKKILWVWRQMSFIVKFCVKNKQTNKYFIVNQDAPKNRKIIINLLQWLAWFKWFSNIEIK